MAKNDNFTRFIDFGIEDENGFIFGKKFNKITAILEIHGKDLSFQQQQVHYNEAVEYGLFLSTISNSNLTINSFIIKDKQIVSDNEESDLYNQFPYAKDIYNQYITPFINDGIFKNNYYVALTLKIKKENIDSEINNLQVIVNRMISYFGDNNAKQLKPYDTQVILKDPIQKVIVKTSPIRSLLYKILTGFDVPIAHSSSEAYINFDNVKVEFKGDLGLITTPEGQKYFQILELADLPDQIESPALSSLVSIGCECIISQSFTGVSKNKALSNIKNKERELNNVESRNAKQYNFANEIHNQVINDEVVLGSYNLTIKVYGNTKEEINTNFNAVRNALISLSIQTKVASEIIFKSMIPSFFGILPGHEDLLTRKMEFFTTLSYSALSSILSFYNGKETGNSWGNAVIPFKTAANSSYFFNYHLEIDGNDFANKTLGHSLILGTSGAGKTILMNFLLNMSLKYSHPDSFYDPISRIQSNDPNEFTLVVFDKDYGCQLNILALGGTYYQIKHSQSTGLNPFIVDNNPENRYQILLLIKQIVESNSDFKLSESQAAVLENAIADVMNDFDTYKKISIEKYHDAIAYPITELLKKLHTARSDDNQDNDLKLKLKNWSKEGRYGWIFDNGTIEEAINITGSNILGIDGTDFLDAEEIAAPISFYLLSKLRNLLDGRRTIIAIDECWKWLQNEEIQIYIRDMLKTMRKSNGLMILATQSPEEILRSKVGVTIMEQCATKILLANPNAKYDDYRNLNLTDVEFEVLKTIRVKSREALVKKENGSIIISMDLSSLSKLNLSLLSSTKENIAIVNNLRAQGLKTDEWIKEFKDIKRL